MREMAQTAIRRPLRVVQLTDTHLFARPEGEFDGVATLASLERVVAAARRAPGWPPDLVVCTGDLVQEERPEAYRLLHRVLHGLDALVCCLPGNHDDPELMTRILRDGNVYLPRLVDRGPWRLVFLDSRVPGEAGGRLGAGQLEWLEATLAGAPGRHACVFVHHQPVPVHSPWMDAMGLADGAALLEVLARAGRARCVVWGHVHQEYDAIHDGLRLLATPSTGVQFAPGAETYRADPRPPGYRWLTLDAGGGVDTGVVRVE